MAHYKYSRAEKRGCLCVLRNCYHLRQSVEGWVALEGRLTLRGGSPDLKQPVKRYSRPFRACPAHAGGYSFVEMNINKFICSVELVPQQAGGNPPLTSEISQQQSQRCCFKMGIMTSYVMPDKPRRLFEVVFYR